MEEKETFGMMLGNLRKNAKYFSNGRNYLSAEQFGILVGKILGNKNIPRDTVAKWESGQTIIKVDERDKLCAIISVLHKYNSIASRQEANSFLQLGKYGYLDDDEAILIDPEWAKSSESKKSEELPDSPIGSEPYTSKGQSNTIIQNYQRNFTENNNGSTINNYFGSYHPGSAPPPPSLFIGRDEDLLALKSRLGAAQKENNNPQLLTIIHGWPGVGKTTIASALAHDKDLKAQFTDAILWTSLGQEPNILSELLAWGRVLGDTDSFRVRTIEEARSHFSALLRNKRALLIIDDVWKTEDAYPFMVGGVNCATLITTRLDGIANSLSPTPANLYRLKVLRDKDALELLEELAPLVVKAHPEECLNLVKELEGLPLAIQVAGRLLHSEASSGFGVLELIEELKTGAKLLESIAPADRMDYVTETTPTIGALLQKSLDRLDNLTKDCYALLGVFAPKPATFNFKIINSLWKINDPKPVIRTLVDRGLLEYIPEIDHYQMHAVLVMLAKSMLTNNDTNPVPVGD